MKLKVWNEMKTKIICEIATKQKLQLQQTI